MTKPNKKVVNPSKEGYAYHIRPSDEYVEMLISLMKKNATIQPMVELSDRNWRDSLNTPIGIVKLGENQREKLVSNGRTEQYGMMVATLTDPCIILEERDAIDNPNHQRGSSFLFVKTFEKEDKSKFIHFESVTVAQDELEVVISSHLIREGQLKKKMKNDRLLYKATALDTTAIISAGQSVNEGGSLSSYDKDSEKMVYGQEFDKNNDVECDKKTYMENVESHKVNETQQINSNSKEIYMMKNDPKYKLTEDAIVVGRTKLFRIEALKDFGTVKAGDKGGWVESENNLSHDGNAWVYDNAQVSGMARVDGNARVGGNALICENAQVGSMARVDGNARVGGNAYVGGYARVSGETQINGKAIEIGNAKSQHPLLKQYQDMKSKHPDAIILFRVGDFYEMLGQDAVEASKILGISITRSMNGNKGAIELAGFPHHALDKYLPNLVRAGKRVAICEQLEAREQKIVENENKETLLNTSDMARKKKNEAPAQEQPKAKADEEAKVIAEVKAEQKKDSQQERKPREPQMVTVNGDKVTHGHAFQSKDNPENWYFTAKINGVQLKPRKMTAEDLAAFRNKEVTVPQLMERYYPTQLMEKVPEEAFKTPIVVTGPNGNMTIDRFNVYKEKNEKSPDFGKYKFYAQIGETKMSTVASLDDLNAYFDRVMTPGQLVEKNFGERLHLPKAYAHLQPPVGMKEGAAKVHKVDGDDKAWYISARVNKDVSTKAVKLSYDDTGSFFAKAVTADQLAGKYLQEEFKAALNKASSMSQSEEISKSMKI